VSDQRSRIIEAGAWMSLPQRLWAGCAGRHREARQHYKSGGALTAPTAAGGRAACRKRRTSWPAAIRTL